MDRRDLLRGAIYTAAGAGAVLAGEHARDWFGPDRLPIDGGYAPANDLSAWVRTGQVSTTWYVPTDEPAIALTFDDGPAPNWTPMVLDLLDDYAAPATFFMVGAHLRAHRTVVTGRLGRHEVGNHTWGHVDLATLDAEKVRAQITATHAQIHDVTAKEPVLLRPPWGHIGGSTLLAADELGYDLVLWSQAMRPRTYGHDTSAQVADIVDHAVPGGIVLAHDVGDANRLPGLRHLGDIIIGLRARGFRLVTVSELLSLRRAA
jgi:peptidoglycan/xylan/chitin deacetylase (PgdA/CDA1 family)